MNRIYHNHNKWEEVGYNMYGNIPINKKNSMIQRVIYFFNNKSLIEKYMAKVVDTFIYSCEHVFTNPSMNHIAWLGQASLALWEKIPRDATIIAWNFLDEKTQDVANNIAKNEIERWKSCQKNI